MSATYNNAILGPVLRVGVIPSANASPNFAIPNGIQSMDGGLLSQNGPQSNNVGGKPIAQAWWIGPDGQNSAPVLTDFMTDAYADIYSGAWYDPEYSAWGVLPSPYLKTARLAYLQNFNGIGIFTYSSAQVPLTTEMINSTGIYSNPTGELYGGYANNFSYGGIDQIIVNSRLASCGAPGDFVTQAAVSIPYGIENLEFTPAGAPFYTTGTCPISPAAQYFTKWLTGPNYRVGTKRGMFSANTTNAAADVSALAFFDESGNWHSTTYTASPTFLGRLWNGFVFSGVFTGYSGCVYTEDYLTFRPLYDATGQIDFTNNGNFGLMPNGLGSNYFIDGFGYSYLANYLQGTTPFTQAAYKIYPAFNFTPLVPDSFFVPSVCGCNRRSNKA